MCFNWFKLWIQLELVRGIAVMPSEFLVSAMETTERQGESRTQNDKERMWSCGEGKDGSFVTFAIVVQSLQPAGYRQKPCRRCGRQRIYLTLLLQPGCSCLWEVAVRCMAKGKQGSVCPSRTLKEAVRLGEMQSAQLILPFWAWVDNIFWVIVAAYLNRQRRGEDVQVYWTEAELRTVDTISSPLHSFCAQLYSGMENWATKSTFFKPYWKEA